LVSRSPVDGRPGRAADLDIFKTLLVWGMITAHCIQLLAFRPKPAAVNISEFINLITFSGFMFAFGWGLGLSRGGMKSWWDRLQPVVLLLAATLVSEIVFEWLVDRQPLTRDVLGAMFSFSRLYGWSEFLASFAVLYLLIAIARPVLIEIGARWYLLIPAIALSLLSTRLVDNRDLPFVATLVGTENFASFPILAYGGWFLLGIFHARNPKRPWWIEWGLAAIATGLLVQYYIAAGNQYPNRFPPSVLFVIGAALPLLIYLAVSGWLARVPIPRVLLGTGRHVLAALLVSNLIIFTLRYLVGYRYGQWWWTPVFAISIIAIVTIWAAALDWRRSRAV
jgi:hypothetical protein